MLKVAIGVERAGFLWRIIISPKEAYMCVDLSVFGNGTEDLTVSSTPLAAVLFALNRIE